MSQADERDLRDRFATLREKDARAAPPLAAVLAAARRTGNAGPRPLRWAPALAAVAVAVVLVVQTVLGPNGPRQPLVDLATARWHSPTDFLLELPGAEYLEAVPGFTTDWRNP